MRVLLLLLVVGVALETRRTVSEGGTRRSEPRVATGPAGRGEGPIGPLLVRKAVEWLVRNPEPDICKQACMLCLRTRVRLWCKACMHEGTCMHAGTCMPHAFLKEVRRPPACCNRKSDVQQEPLKTKEAGNLKSSTFA